MPHQFVHQTVGISQIEFADTIGWIYLKKNLTDNALEIFENIVKSKPMEPIFRYHLALALIGRAVGDNWHQWKDYLHYVDYAVLAAIILGIAYLIIRRRRGAWEPTPPA